MFSAVVEPVYAVNLRVCTYIQFYNANLMGHKAYIEVFDEIAYRIRDASNDFGLP